MVRDTRPNGGPAIDEQFDFALTGTGDIGLQQGTDRIEADLAFQLATVLEQYLGAQPSPDTRAAIKSDAKQVAELDTRIDTASVPQNTLDIAREQISLGLRVTLTTGVTEQLQFDRVVEV